MQNVEIQSWVKIPIAGQKGWEKKYARLENTQLCIYEHEPTSGMSPVTKFNLCPTDGVGKVLKDVTASDCQNTAGTDLPFIIKICVGPDTTCWPDKTQFLMFLNATDKEKWVQHLDDLFKKTYPECKKNYGDKIAKLVNNEQVNCTQEINKTTLLLGCEEGLYSCVEQKPLVHITGLTQIHQIGLIKSANIALFICDEKRILVKTELKQLESLSQRAQFTNPHLTTQKINVNNREGFHIFQASDFTKKQIVCAATSKQLFIIKYDYESRDFLPLRVLDTAEPCSCILFNEHSVIVGANKYFEIDLKTFSADEFLDGSDHRLAQAYNCYKMGSYPVSIMLVNKQPLEYLLCFNEFGCFVDEYGRRSRENDIKWSHLPVAFLFSAPFLYIVQFAAVEIVRINPDDADNISLKSWECPDSVRLEFSKVKFLGSSKRGIYILVKNEVIYISGKGILGEIESEDEISDSEISDVGTEFSFTSSQLQSLDRLSSDGETNEKRVHFAHQTDL